MPRDTLQGGGFRRAVTAMMMWRVHGGGKRLAHPQNLARKRRKTTNFELAVSPAPPARGFDWRNIQIDVDATRSCGRPVAVAVDTSAP